MQDFFRCAEGYEERATKALAKSFRCRISDMHYEARLRPSSIIVPSMRLGR